MSLINQMLRDLDARRAPAADRAQLQDIVHAAPKAAGTGGSRAGLLLGIGALAAVAGGAWYWLTPASVPQATPAPAAQQPQAPAQPAAVQAPATLAPAATVAAMPATAPAAVKSAEPATQEPAKPAAREAAKPAARPAAAPVAKPAPVPHAPEAAPVAKAAPPASKPVALAAAARPASPAEEPSIEKRPRTPLANEAAENEYNKAVAALRRGATVEAVAELRAALRLDMLHVSARQALLSLLLSQQQFGDAQAVAEEGLALDPSQTGWAIVLARLQMENGKTAEATETLASHARYADRNADYQAFHALLLQKQKRYHEAADRYVAAVTLRPGEGRWWYGLGVALDADQRPQEAHEAFVKARDSGNLPPELAASLKHYLR
ncbi:MAG TPA: tetratricopeptide repeat protein [Rhodocyclaceae bacterium]